MEYKHADPVTKPQRATRRRSQRGELNKREESNRRKSLGGGRRPNELGITQGQNGEQGNSTDPRNTVPFAKPGSE